MGANREGGVLRRPSSTAQSSQYYQDTLATSPLLPSSPSLASLFASMAQAWPPRRIWTGRFHSGLTHLDLRVGRRLLLLRLRVALSGAAVLRRRPSASAACRESRAGEAVLLHGARRHTAAQLAVTRHSCIMPNRLHATVPSCTPTSASCTGHPAISHSRLPPPTGVVPGLSLSLCPVCDMPGSQSRQSEGARLPPGVAPWLRPLCRPLVAPPVSPQQNDTE